MAAAGLDDGADPPPLPELRSFVRGPHETEAVKHMIENFQRPTFHYCVGAARHAPYRFVAHAVKCIVKFSSCWAAAEVQGHFFSQSCLIASRAVQSGYRGLNSVPNDV